MLLLSASAVAAAAWRAAVAEGEAARLGCV
jgi:hypothetical protein